MMSTETTDQQLLEEALGIERQLEVKRQRNEKIRELEKTLPKEELETLMNEARIRVMREQKQCTNQLFFSYDLNFRHTMRALIAERYLNEKLDTND